MRFHWFAPLRRGAALFWRTGGMRTAAALAYYLILALFPALICLSYLPAWAGQQLLSGAETLLPAAAAELLRGYLAGLEGKSAPGLFFSALTTSVVGASAAVRTLMNAMDALHGRPPRHGVRHLWQSVVLSFFYLGAVLLSLVVVFTGDWLFQLLEQTLLWPAERLPGLRPVWRVVKYLLLFCGVLLFVLLLYRTGAPRGRPVPVLRGAVAASAAIAVCSGVFSAFVGMSARYSLLYGSLASVMVLLVWLYLCGNLLLLGDVVNVVLENHRKGEK